MLLEEFDKEKYERTLREEGQIKGILSVLNSLVKDGVLTLSEAASRASMTEEAYVKQVEALNL